jgi:hypothetical protein
MMRGQVRVSQDRRQLSLESETFRVVTLHYSVYRECLSY